MTLEELAQEVLDQQHAIREFREDAGTLARGVLELSARVREVEAERDQARATVCPHCHLPLCLPDVCTPAINAAIEERLASDAKMFSAGREHGISVSADEVRALQAEVEKLRAENERLREWRATVTCALQNPGGAHFDDVARLLRNLRQANDENLARAGQAEERLKCREAQLAATDVLLREAWRQAEALREAILAHIEDPMSDAEYLRDALEGGK